MNKIEEVEKLLNLDDDEILQLYRSWDKGDCSLVRLIEILLYQEIRDHKKANGQYYDTDYDEIKLRIK
jgi:hypothetical protein